MVFNAAGGSNENINTPSELISLVVDWDTAVNCENVVLSFIVFKRV